MPIVVVRPAVPDAAQLAAITGLVAASRAEDGREPLSDQALTRLGAAAVEHALAMDGDRVVGYAQRDGGSLEIVAAPTAVGALLDTFAGPDLLVWSHGRASRIAPALRAHGFVPARELFQLRRPLIEAPPEPALPDGVELRAFVPGQDEAAWLRVNAAAFAHHPEQGGWTADDLAAREAEPWFDPAGFLLAWRDSELVGFHWTKVHPDGAGEVYVIGVDPAAQGSGLGAALLPAGLAALHARGCREVLLYVDGSNAAARRLYARQGFTEHDVDVQWRSPAAPGQPSSTGSESKT